MDITAWPFLLCLILTSNVDIKQQLIRIAVIAAAAFVLIPIATGSSIDSHSHQATNTLLLRDTAPNIGLYYYIAIELFPQHTDFFLMAYQAFAMVLALQLQ